VTAQLAEQARVTQGRPLHDPCVRGREWGTVLLRRISDMPCPYREGFDSKGRAAFLERAAGAMAAYEWILHPRKLSDPYKAEGSATHAEVSEAILYAWYGILLRAFDSRE